MVKVLQARSHARPERVLQVHQVTSGCALDVCAVTGCGNTFLRSRRSRRCRTLLYIGLEPAERLGSFGTIDLATWGAHNIDLSLRRCGSVAVLELFRHRGQSLSAAASVQALGIDGSSVRAG